MAGNPSNREPTSDEIRQECEAIRAGWGPADWARQPGAPKPVWIPGTETAEPIGLGEIENIKRKIGKSK